MNKQKIISILEHAEQIKKILNLAKADSYTDGHQYKARIQTIQTETETIIVLAESLRDTPDGIR